jgi:hypothetical protein
MIADFLKHSDAVRPGYSATLGSSGIQSIPATLLAELPDWLKELYAQVSGTPADITDQRMMDFIPGYRLIEARELDGLRDAVRRQYGEIADRAIPFLVNYSDDYICYDSGTVVLLDHVSPDPAVLHDRDERFLETHCAFYRQGVYTLDSDGYLTADYDKAGVLGQQYNPGVAYWVE